MNEMLDTQLINRIMIFGRPGSGKSTFAMWLSHTLNLPLHHLDKYFFIENWVERSYSEFLQIQQNFVNNDSWVIDGNSTRSLEMRWTRANLVLYFNFSKPICYFRILHRWCKPNSTLDDRAQGCDEVISWSLVKYLWSFEKRVAQDIVTLRQKYPNTIFKEIRNKNDLDNLKYVLQDFTRTYI